MKTIVIAGATGHLGGLIADHLLKKGAHVKALVRYETHLEKESKLRQHGVEVVKVKTWTVEDLQSACKGANCVISALAGLKEVILDAQLSLLNAAVKANVAHFIPSDYSIDFTRLIPGTNRNLEFRKQFREYLLKAPIHSTSILNGVFSDLLLYAIPLIDFKKHQVCYWEDADLKLDFTAIDNVAEFAASAALDLAAPPILRIAGDQLSARELAANVSEVKKQNFELKRLGSLNELTSLIQQERDAHPEGENELYPNWQGMQYLHSMFSGKALLHPLDNKRYPGIQWQTVKDVLCRK